MRKTTNVGREKWKSARSEEKPLIMGEKKWKSARFQKKQLIMREKRAKKKNTSFGYLRRKLGET